MPGVPPKVGEMLKNIGRSLFNRKKKDKKKATAPEPAQPTPSAPPASEPALITPVVAPVANAPTAIEPGTSDAPKTEDTRPAPGPGQTAEPSSVQETEAQIDVLKTGVPKADAPKVEQSIIPPAPGATPRDEAAPITAPVDPPPTTGLPDQK